MNKYEIVMFVDQEFKLDVDISPLEKNMNYYRTYSHII